MNGTLIANQYAREDVASRASTRRTVISYDNGAFWSGVSLLQGRMCAFFFTHVTSEDVDVISGKKGELSFSYFSLASGGNGKLTTLVKYLDYSGIDPRSKNCCTFHQQVKGGTGYLNLMNSLTIYS